MPVYLNPKIGDCSSYDSSDCAPSYKHGALLPDEEDWDYTPSEIPPEETDDYIEAMERYEEHLAQMSEAITIFDEVYWKRLQRDLREALQLWSGWVSEKLLVLGTEVVACLVAGGIFMGALIILLTCLGPMRIKTLGVLLVTFVIGSIFITESIEMAAASFIGATLLLFLFFARVTTGSRVLTVKNRSLKTKLNQDQIHVFIDFWYCGDRSVWINLDQNVIGIL